MSDWDFRIAEYFANELPNLAKWQRHFHSNITMVEKIQPRMKHGQNTE